MRYVSETWCLKEREMIILRSTERSMVRAVCGVHLKDRRSKNFMLVLDLIETIDQLAMANSVHLNGHVWRREDGFVLRRALYFEVEGHRMKGRSKRT